jgi:hypothetical protein
MRQRAIASGTTSEETAAFCRALRECAARHSERFSKTGRDYAEFVHHEIIPNFAMVFAVWCESGAPCGLGMLLIKDTANEQNPDEAQGATAFWVAGRGAARELLADLCTFTALDNALIGARMH